MQILMFGSNFTFANNIPETLAKFLGAKFVYHTRGDALLAEQLNLQNKNRS